MHCKHDDDYNAWRRQYDERDLAKMNCIVEEPIIEFKRILVSATISSVQLWPHWVAAADTFPTNDPF